MSYRHIFLLLLSNLLIPISLIIFATGFFPYKAFIGGHAAFSGDREDAEVAGSAPFDKVIFMVVDALRRLVTSILHSWPLSKCQADAARIVTSSMGTHPASSLRSNRSGTAAQSHSRPMPPPQPSPCLVSKLSLQARFHPSSTSSSTSQNRIPRPI